MYRLLERTAADADGIGRIVEVHDEARRELRAYGKLGELVSVERALRPVLPGDRVLWTPETAPATVTVMTAAGGANKGYKEGGELKTGDVRIAPFIDAYLTPLLAKPAARGWQTSSLG